MSPAGQRLSRVCRRCGPLIGARRASCPPESPGMRMQAGAERSCWVGRGNVLRRREKAGRRRACPGAGTSVGLPTELRSPPGWGQGQACLASRRIWSSLVIVSSEIRRNSTTLGQGALLFSWSSATHATPVGRAALWADTQGVIASPRHVAGACLIATRAPTAISPVLRAPLCSQHPDAAGTLACQREHTGYVHIRRHSRSTRGLTQ